MSLENLTPEEMKHLKFGEMVLNAKDKEIVKQGKRLAQKIDPTLKLPELDLEDKIAAEAKAREEWEEKWEEKRREERYNQRRAEEAEKSRAAGFDPEEIEKIVIEEKCSFPTALKLAGLQRESAVPGAASYGSGLPLNKTREDGGIDWRKLSPSDARRKGLDIAHQGIEDLLRRQRGGR